MDRRQRKTKQAIYQAFDELMAHQPYAAITVASLIEHADIGRSTFYAHYETKDDLLKELCSEMFDHVFDGVDSHCITHAKLKTNDLHGRLAHLLYHLRDNHGSICGKLLKEAEPHFTSNFKARLAELIKANLPARALRDVPHDLSLEIWVSAFCQTVVWWVEHDMACDPEVLSGWYCELCMI